MDRKSKSVLHAALLHMAMIGCPSELTVSCHRVGHASTEYACKHAFVKLLPRWYNCVASLRFICSRIGSTRPSHSTVIPIIALRLLLPMARSKSSASLDQLAAKRLGVLQAIGKHTKNSTFQMLMQLQLSGALAGNDTEHRLKKMLQIGIVSHSKTMTPYGLVVQAVDLGAPGLSK